MPQLADAQVRAQKGFAMSNKTKKLRRGASAAEAMAYGLEQMRRDPEWLARTMRRVCRMSRASTSPLSAAPTVVQMARAA